MIIGYDDGEVDNGEVDDGDDYDGDGDEGGDYGRACKVLACVQGGGQNGAGWKIQTGPEFKRR